MLHRSIALLLATGAVTSAFTTPSASVKPSHASNFGKRIISHRISASISEDGLEFADDVDRTTETILDASEMLIDPTGALAEALPPMVEIDGATQTLFAEPPAVETDVAKDLVLDAISGTTPDMFDTEAAAFMNTEGAAIQTEKRGLDAEKRGLDALLTEDLSQTKAIETILAVSQQAAEAAEATLDDAVSDSIPLIPPRQFNDTVGSMPEILPAKDVVGTPATSKESFDYPSVRRIMTFAASATGVFLCSPLLSLIDTSAVGLLSGTAQQAALNPAIAVSDYAALLIVSTVADKFPFGLLIIFANSILLFRRSSILVPRISSQPHKRRTAVWKGNQSRRSHSLPRFNCRRMLEQRWDRSFSSLRAHFSKRSLATIQ